MRGQKVGFKHSEKTKILMSGLKKGKPCDFIKTKFKKGHTPWNIGLTKETDETIRKSAEKTSKKLKGHTPWNKDLTMETDKRVKGNRKFDNEQEKEIISSYGKNSITQIANKLKCSPTTVLKILKENNLPIKRATYFNKGKKQSEELITKRIKASMKNQTIKPNKPEKFLIELFGKDNIPLYYVGNGQLIIGGRCPDFVCNPSKKVVLLHGDWWHYLKPKRLNPLLTREQVEENDKIHYQKYFFEALIIWEHELKNPKRVLNKINEFIK